MKGKRFLAALLALVILVSLTACGGGTDAADPEEDTPGGENTPAALSMTAEVERYLGVVDQEYVRNLAEILAYHEEYLSNDLGWRSAGSDAEHAAADFLAEEMTSLGLTEVEKVPVTVDRWQFNDASLTITGTDIDIMPAAFPANGTGPEGLTAEIVDCGGGFAADYEGKDVEGKIVLVGMDWDSAGSTTTPTRPGSTALRPW